MEEQERKAGRSEKRRCVEGIFEVESLEQVCWLRSEIRSNGKQTTV